MAQHQVGAGNEPAMPPCPACGHQSPHRVSSCPRCGRPLVGPVAGPVLRVPSLAGSPTEPVPNPGQTVRRSSLAGPEEGPYATEVTALAPPPAPAPAVLSESAPKVQTLPASASPQREARGGPVDLGRRFAAYLVDCALSFLIIVALYFAMTVFVLAAVASMSMTMVNLAITLSSISYLGAMGMSAAYAWRTVAIRGQTVGKAVMGIRIVDSGTQQPIGYGRTLARGFYQLLMLLPFGLGYLTVLNDTSGWHRGWHDTLARSVVVSAPPLPLGRAIKDAWNVTIGRSGRTR